MKTKHNDQIGRISLLVVLIIWVAMAGCSSGRRTTRPAAGSAAAPAAAEPTSTPAAAAIVGLPTSTAAATAGGNTPTPPDITGARVRPRLNAVNIRRGPGTQFEVIGLLRQDETARALGRDAAGTWLNIMTDAGLDGWVAANVVEFVAGAMDTLDVVTTRPAVPATITTTATAAVAPPPADDSQPQPPQSPSPTATATTNSAPTSTPDPNGPPGPYPTPTGTSASYPYPPPTETSAPYPPPTAVVTPNPYP